MATGNIMWIVDVSCERERERGREKERRVHGRLFLGGPCNEVHGMLLLLILRKGPMCLSCLCVCIQLLNGQRARIAFRGGISCDCQRDSLMLRIATFFSLCEHGITALIGAPGNGNSLKRDLT